MTDHWDETYTKHIEAVLAECTDKFDVVRRVVDHGEDTAWQDAPRHAIYVDGVIDTKKFMELLRSGSIPWFGPQQDQMGR